MLSHQCVVSCERLDWDRECQVAFTCACSLDVFQFPYVCNHGFYSRVSAVANVQNSDRKVINQGVDNVSAQEASPTGHQASLLPGTNLRVLSCSYHASLAGLLELILL